MNFGNAMNSDERKTSITLENKTKGTNEAIKLEWIDARTVEIWPESKYLSAGDKYVLYVTGTDIKDKRITPFSAGFDVAEGGGLSIVGTEFLKEGQPLSVNDLAEDDVVKVKVSYVLTDINKKQENVIFAAVGEKNNKVCAFAQSKVNFDKAGLNSEEITFTVGEDFPENISAYLWDVKTRLPITDGVSISK